MLSACNAANALLVIALLGLDAQTLAQAGTHPAASSQASERQPTQRPLLGRVVDEQGQPVGKATVHLALVPAGRADRLASLYRTATTDSRGRFRFQTQPCTRHQIWATSAAGADGAHVVSEIQFASPGGLVELALRHSQPAARLVVEGAAAWPEAQPLTIRPAPSATGLPIAPIALDEDFGCELPALPAGYVTFDILDKGGKVLQSRTILELEKSTVLLLDTPHDVPMRVVDEGGQPIAGARLRLRTDGGWSNLQLPGPGDSKRSIWRDLGHTDADGRLVARIPTWKNPFESSSSWLGFFVATKDGFDASHAGFVNKPFCDGVTVDGEGLEELRFTLRPAKPYAVRLMLDDQRPLAGHEVLVRRSVRVTDDNSSSQEPIAIHHSTDEQGWLQFPRLRMPQGAIKLLLGNGPSRAELIPKQFQRMAPLGVVALHPRPTQAGVNKVEPETVIVGRFPKLRLEVFATTDIPANEAEVMLVSRSGGGGACDACTPMAVTNMVGRLFLRVEPGEWLLFVRHDQSYACAEIDVDADRQVELHLKPRGTMRGTVVDADGKPIAGARLQCSRSTWTKGGHQDPAVDAIAQRMNERWISRTVSGPDGSFACTILDQPNRKYSGYFTADSKRSERFEIVVQEEPVTITVRKQ